MALGNVNSPGAFGKSMADRLSNAEKNLTGMSAAGVGAVPATDKGKPNGVASLDASGKLAAGQKPAYTASEVGAKASTWSAYQAGTSAPTDKTKLWIDTTANTGGLKYWSGSAWVHVPVAYT